MQNQKHRQNNSNSSQKEDGEINQTDKKPWWSGIGPGLITGAADDDPSGIGTYSQAGARFGFDLLWSMFLAYPLMTTIQIISARIGAVSGHGLATHIRNLYPRWILISIITALCVANTINIGADIAAMGDATALLIGTGSSHWYALGFGLLSLILQVTIPYRRYVKFLKWLTLVVYSYIATAFAQKIEWQRVLTHIIHPQWHWQKEYITTFVAILGTTISPYLFFWQSSEEVEELKRQGLTPIKRSHNPVVNSQRFRELNRDTLIGMSVSCVVAFFIILSTAVALHENGITRIQTSADAARALQPIAGETAFLLFTLGIIGTGLLAVPVLAGSCAYAISGACQWKASLEHSFAEARAFYSVIIVTILIGTGLCFTPINPMEALYWAAVINGVVAVPLIAVLLLMAKDQRVMGKYGIGRPMQSLGWITMFVMGASALAMIFFMV